jgi:hypothetical protein
LQRRIWALDGILIPLLEAAEDKYRTKAAGLKKGGLALNLTLDHPYLGGKKIMKIQMALLNNICSR